MSTPSRRTILFGLAVGLLVASFFVTHVPLTPAMSGLSCLSVVLFALPSYRAILQLQGAKRGGALLLCLGVYGLAIESFALATGIPYGSFTYSGLLASKVFGLAPWTVAFAYPPIILFAYVLACRLNKKRTKANLWYLSGITALLATACDVVLDPAAVRLRFWYWDQSGFFYGVPLVNFIGWLLTSFVAALLFRLLWGDRPAPSAVAYSGLAIIWFWTAANLWFSHLLSVMAGGFLLGLAWHYLPRLATTPKSGVQ